MTNTALEKCLSNIEAASHQRKAHKEAVRSMRRVEVLQQYANRKRAEIKNVHWFAQYTCPEFYLAKAAEKLIYLNWNRVACRAIGKDFFASDKAILAEVLEVKRIGRGLKPLKSKINVIEGRVDPYAPIPTDGLSPLQYAKAVKNRNDVLREMEV